MGEGFTEKQMANGRLAESLREMIPYATDINCGEAAPGIPIIWPASNIKEILGWAADLIEELTIGAAP